MIFSAVVFPIAHGQANKLTRTHTLLSSKHLSSVCPDIWQTCATMQLYARWGVCVWACLCCVSVCVCGLEDSAVQDSVMFQINQASCQSYINTLGSCLRRWLSHRGPSTDPCTGTRMNKCFILMCTMCTSANMSSRITSSATAQACMNINSFTAVNTHLYLFFL